MVEQNKAALEGIRVLDFGHTVMGPSCGAILADLGAEVIKIEPTGAGDPTRHLRGFGSGYFGFFGRNKKSVSIDLKSKSGQLLMEKLLIGADVLIENFAPGTMNRLGLDFARAQQINPGLIYASLKGFMPGPYENRLALDEVVQMMGGLAFMTGPSGQPLRAGTSVVDIAGGMFAVIGILTALRDRDRTGQGQCVETALFESLVYLMGQHLCYAWQSKDPIPPMPERVSAWAVYQIFECRNDDQLFVGVTSDNHWQRLCRQLGWEDFLKDESLRTNNQRITSKDRIIDRLQAMLMDMEMEDAMAHFEAARIPFAPVQRPEDLFADKHLRETGGLVDTALPDGTNTSLPRLPLQLSRSSLAKVKSPPKVGADTLAILRDAGISEDILVECLRARAIQTAD